MDKILALGFYQHLFCFLGTWLSYKFIILDMCFLDSIQQSTLPEGYTVGIEILDQIPVESSKYYTSIFLRATIFINIKALRTPAGKKYVILLNIAFSYKKYFSTQNKQRNN